jgi:hypothetical protein
MSRDPAARRAAAEQGALAVGTIQRVPPNADLAGRFLADAIAAIGLVPSAVETYPPGAVLILWDGVRKACAAHAIGNGIRFTQEASHGKALTYIEHALDGLVPPQAFGLLRLVLSERNDGAYVDPNRQAINLVDRAPPRRFQTRGDDSDRPRPRPN